MIAVPGALTIERGHEHAVALELLQRERAAARAGEGVGELAGHAVFAGPADAQASVSEGQKLTFDRGKGNCLTCHDIRGGDLPGTIGPPLKDIKSKYPDRNDLVAILTDETQRNPLTVMPPFGRNRILTSEEINAIVDFLQHGDGDKMRAPLESSDDDD